MIDKYGVNRCDLCEGQLKEGDISFCSYCKPSISITPKIKKKKEQKYKSLDNRQYLSILCIKCNKSYKICTNNISIYTKKVLDKWVCSLCRGKK